MIRKLCEKFTTLNESDIQLLYNVNEFLPLISQVTNGDVFIDCMTREPDTAIVVAEAKKKKSLYKKNVVGEFALRENEPAVLRTMDTGLTTRELKGISQENIPIEQSVTAIKNGDKVVGTLIVEKDATKDFAERRNIEILSETAQQLTQALMFHNRGEEHKIDYITNYVTDGIMIFDKEGVVIYANPMAISIYKKIGYKDDIIGMHFDNVALDEKTFKDVTETTYMEVPEIHIGKLNLNVQYSVLKNKDDDQRLVVLIRDMTELRNREKELILKSVAIREIHHRVKNNLQTIASLLRMQSRRITDDQAKKAFSESINRVLSIAVTHELLAQNGVDDVDIKDILTNLVQNTIYYNSKPSTNIKIEITGDNFSIDSDKATSIALAVNELVQNCMEYAFPNRKEGNIRIHIEKDELYSKIIVADDGVGFDKTERPAGSLGLNIVEGLVVEKLDGSFEISSSPFGTQVEIEIINKCR